ncbi:MFS transporter [Nocardia jiangxiensis]|uniref:MFS transporter n=1 Tax=Nocardia jiangxiensis TaxID=282685 RepID=A0ABW6RYQ0_9NOCA
MVCMTVDSSNATDWTIRRVATLILLAGIGELAIFVFSAVSTALPILRRDFPDRPVEWVISAQSLVGGVLAPLLGKLADRYGKKRMLVVAGSLIALGGLLCALPAPFPVLLLGRSLQGLIVAVVFLSYSLLRDIFPTRLVPVAASVSVTGMGVMTILQPILTGWLIDRFGWHAVFWFLLAYSALFTLAIAAVVPESAVRSRGHIDWTGAALLGFGLGLLLLVIGRGSTWGWVSGRTAGLLAAAVVLLVSWVVSSRRISQPLVDIRLLGSRSVALSIVSAGLISAACALMLTLIPFLVMAPRSVGGTYGFGSSATGVARYTAPIGVCLLVFGFVAGRAIRAVGPRLPMAAGAFLVAVGLIGVVVWHDQPWQVIVFVVVYGAGQGTAYGSAPNLIIRSVPPEQQAITSSLMESAKGLGPAIAMQAVFAVLAATALSPSGKSIVYSGFGLSLGFGIGAVIAVVSCLAAVFLKAQRDTTDLESAATEMV